MEEVPQNGRINSKTANFKQSNEQSLCGESRTISTDAKLVY